MSKSEAPPWEAIELVWEYLDPKSLAMSSCVCKSWSNTMSSNTTIWSKLCSTQFPYLSPLSTAIPPNRLYSLAQAATTRRRQLQKSPPKPTLSLSDLTFAITIVSTKHPHRVLGSTIKPCSELVAKGETFAFDVGVGVGVGVGVECLEDVRVAWVVGLRGWKSVAVLAEKEGFPANLPAVGWCFCGGAGCGVAADLKVVLDCEKVKAVSVGIFDVAHLRYVSVDDGLRYLDHFLLPPLNHHHRTCNANH